MTFFITLLILCALFWIGFKITGALIKALIWLCIMLPIGLCIMLLGLFLCCTIILIPLGTRLLKAGASLILPGKYGDKS